MPTPSRCGERCVAGGDTRASVTIAREILPTAIGTARRMAYVGLACGVLYSVGGLAYDALTTVLNLGTAMASGALVGMPAVFGGLGFLAGALVAGGVRALRRPPRR